MKKTAYIVTMIAAATLVAAPVAAHARPHHSAAGAVIAREEGVTLHEGVNDHDVLVPLTDMVTAYVLPVGNGFFGMMTIACRMARTCRPVDCSELLEL